MKFHPAELLQRKIDPKKRQQKENRGEMMAAKGEEVRQGRPQVSKFYYFFLHSYFYCVKYFFGPLYTLRGPVVIYKCYAY